MLNKHLKALIVDDEDHVRELLSMVTSSLEFGTVIETSNGKDAVKVFIKESPDLVLLDINMPKMGGEKVLSEINGISKDSCIIVLTAVCDRETVQKCFKLGANHFIVKNQPIQKMTEIIQETWEKFREERKQRKIEEYKNKVNFDKATIELNTKIE